MIRWLQQEEGEGRFNSKFEAFNQLSDSVINEIGEGLISCAKEGGLDEELSVLDSPLGIFRYCWFDWLHEAL